MILFLLFVFADISPLVPEASFSTAHSNVGCSSAGITQDGLHPVHGSLLIYHFRSLAACRWAFDDIYNLPDVLRRFLFWDVPGLLATLSSQSPRTISIYYCGWNDHHTRAVRNWFVWRKQVYYHYLQEPTFHQIAYDFFSCASIAQSSLNVLGG